MRVTCGNPPLVTMAAYDGKQYFYEDKVSYTCQDGYSITGLIGGDKNFEIECQDDGTFEDPDSCNPVQCGVPPPLPNGIRPEIGRASCRERV